MNSIIIVFAIQKLVQSTVGFYKYWYHLLKSVAISLRLQGKLGFPYNVTKLMVKYVLLY